MGALGKLAHRIAGAFWRADGAFGRWDAAAWAVAVAWAALMLALKLSAYRMGAYTGDGILFANALVNTSPVAGAWLRYAPDGLDRGFVSLLEDHFQPTLLLLAPLVPGVRARFPVLLSRAGGFDRRLRPSTDDAARPGPGAAAFRGGRAFPMQRFLHARRVRRQPRLPQFRAFHPALAADGLGEIRILLQRGVPCDPRASGDWLARR